MRSHTHPIARSRCGLSQVEVAVSTVIVAVLMVTSLSTIAASRRSQMTASNEVRGLAIAESLMAEITQLPMRDPACDCGFGAESGETSINRLPFDDVDDYLNLVDSPPKSRPGTALSGYSDFSRNVSVEMVTTGNWNTTTSTYAGIYRITIRVLRGTTEVSKIVGYRSAGSQGVNALTSTSTAN